MRTILLLTFSNIFMTIAWYGHLKHRGAALWKVIWATSSNGTTAWASDSLLSLRFSCSTSGRLRPQRLRQSSRRPYQNILPTREMQ
jgi:hypothetical protein